LGSQGPPFLLLPPESWPTNPTERPEIDKSELKKSAFCGVVAVEEPTGNKYRTWAELVKATAQELHGAAGQSGEPTASMYQAAETCILQKVQNESFPEELQRLKAGKALQHNSRLLTLAAEYDPSTNLIRVGGRLRRAETLDPALKHPIVLESRHPAVKLLLQDYDERLCHPGPDTGVFCRNKTTLLGPKRKSSYPQLTTRLHEMPTSESQTYNSPNGRPSFGTLASPQASLSFNWDGLLWSLSCKDWSTSRKEVGNPLQMSYHPGCTHRPSVQFGH